MVTKAGRKLSAIEAQKLLGIPASTVRTWHQRKDRTGLLPVEFDRQGKPRFRESDLLRLRDGKRTITGPSPTERYGDFGRYLTAKDAERVLGIPASTVATWHQRVVRTGLRAVGHDNYGHPFFYEVDLIALKKGMGIVKDDFGERVYTMRNVA